MARTHRQIPPAWPRASCRSLDWLRVSLLSLSRSLVGRVVPWLVRILLNCTSWYTVGSQVLWALTSSSEKMRVNELRIVFEVTCSSDF